MAAFSHDGLWWDASDPGQKWTGTLRVDRRRGTSLKVVVPVETPEFHRELGRTTSSTESHQNGKPFTLIDCYDGFTRGSFELIVEFDNVVGGQDPPAIVHDDEGADRAVAVALLVHR